MRLRIVTPERILLEREVESVTVPTQTGEITVMQNHVPLVSNLQAGELRFKSEGGENYFAVSGGFVEVRGDNQVIILADTAEHGHEIDLDRAQQARDDARKLMQDKRHDSEASAEAMALLEKNLARLRVGHKHRTKTNRNLESGILHE